VIWFACKQCGKRLRQPDSAGGSFVFCDCGGGNRVPWESTIAAPVEAPIEASTDETSEADERDVPRRTREPVAIDPAYCLNHADVPSEKDCDDCHERFCAACVVVVRGKTLCGPCKNYRLARIQRPPRTSGMAIVSLVLAIIGGPLSFCLSTVGRMGDLGTSPTALAWGVGALLLPAIALLLAFLALGQIERNPRVSGRALALTGATTAAIGVVWSLTMLLVLAGKPLVN
jgi:hypothetical protein